MFEGQPKGLYALALANTGERYKRSLVSQLPRLQLSSDRFWLLFISCRLLVVSWPISSVTVKW